ncbi:MAG: flavodoxin, partial [Candidatus Methanomethylicia archaeon]
MKVAIIYYSKTGKTKKVAKEILEELLKLKLIIDVFEIRNLSEYSNILLHLNPRLIYETKSDRDVEIIGDENFNTNEYDVLIIGSPIWYNNITPAIRTFIKKNCGKINSQIICFTTSTYNIDYSKNFRNYLERLGYKVLLNKSITKQNEKSGVKELIENIKGHHK